MEMQWGVWVFNLHYLIFSGKKPMKTWDQNHLIYACNLLNEKDKLEKSGFSDKLQ